jgi:CO dehydrogenase maturation factor
VGLKLAISGKGGVGKTTLAGTLARLVAGEGRRVLAVDADPDANLAYALGIPADRRREIVTLSEERQLIEERTGAKVREFGQIFALNPDVSGIAEQYATHHAGVDLLVLGAAGRAGGGCACPENVLLRSLVRHLVLRRDEVVILDMEAGIEHLGRATAAGVDLMLAVVDAGQRSVETAHRVQRMAAEIGIDRFAVVGNKLELEGGEASARLARELGPERLLASIPYDTRIIEADRAGRSLVEVGDDDLLQPFAQILQIVLERYERPPVGADRGE